MGAGVSDITDAEVRVDRHQILHDRAAALYGFD
jgi:hypothetical protein